MRIRFNENGKDVLFVNVLQTRKHQFNVVVVSRSCVINILLNVFFVTLAANKECHFNRFLIRSNMKTAYFIPRVVRKYKKIFNENINCQYST